MELRSSKGYVSLHQSQVTILGRQHLLEHFDLQSKNISRWGQLVDNNVQMQHRVQAGEPS